MPSRAYTSFLRQQQKRNIPVRYQSVNALSGLYLISTGKPCFKTVWNKYSVNALSGLYLISTHISCYDKECEVKSVNALSGLYLISTLHEFTY